MFLSGRELVHVTIHDPYALTDSANSEKLEGFLQLLHEIVPTLTEDLVAIRYRSDMALPSRNEENKFKHRHPQIRHVAKAAHTGDFHDRRIEFHLIKPPAPGKTLKTRKGAAAMPARENEIIVVDVSGGIGRLMDQRLECRLYRYPVV